ncbi:3-oxoacyl-[acyl-carrier-protein] reductase [Candidatus Endowatersipora endosymbiont of Watersipora subatra]|uniref:3-oxoacyl-[acyl-carrier-protein] reductase n=1 Tax=Candidatus Endowatersipora endosymbiont of Watersipora subatra TaxID=3077946 RepID=UPI00312C86A7
MFDLTGKKALITGASGGIGEAIAKHMHSYGAIVGLHGTREEKLFSIANQLGERVYVFSFDLSVASHVKSLARTAERDMKGVDILVNNAGVARDSLFVRMSDEDWNHVITINLTSIFQLTRKMIYPMLRRRFGRVVNITSVVGIIGNPGQANYCASKAGMIGMSKSLAIEIASRGITVNCVAPGFIKTQMANTLDDKKKNAILSSVPAKRLGKPEEVASVVTYLAGSEASYITGQTIHVNGGMAMI